MSRGEAEHEQCDTFILPYRLLRLSRKTDPCSCSPEITRALVKPVTGGYQFPHLPKVPSAYADCGPDYCMICFRQAKLALVGLAFVGPTSMKNIHGTVYDFQPCTYIMYLDSTVGLEARSGCTSD